MDAFLDFTLLFGLAAVLALLINRLKQPLILGYIAAGVIIHVSGILDSHSLEGFELFSKIGIVFLLFILGLELDIQDLGSLGIASFITGIGQIVFTVLFGMIIAVLLGYGFTSSLIIAIALTFSSTIVIVKLLSSKGDLDSMYGKVSIGFLLVQDLVAIIILILLSASLQASEGSSMLTEIAQLTVVLPLLVLSLYLVNKFVIPALISFTQYDREVLFVSIVAFALGYAAIVSTEQVGLSVEIGALAAGIALSNRRESLQIESWTKPLRDFFIPVFFVLLGFEIQLGEVSNVIIPSVIFSIFILIGNPFIVMVIMRFLKFDTIVGFQAGLTVAQISEFSLLVAAIALENGTISQSDLTMLTIVGGITMTASSYMILYSEELYDKLRPLIKRTWLYSEEEYDVESFKRKRVQDRIIIFGFNRMSRSLHEVIKSKKKKFLVIDNDPAQLEYAERLGATTAFGDLKDETLLHDLKLEQADLIISTVPDIQANLGLLYTLEKLDIKIPVIVNAFYDQDALTLYEQGADFVIHPYILTSNFLQRVVTNKDTLSSLKRAAKKDRSLLKKQTRKLYTKLG